MNERRGQSPSSLCFRPHILLWLLYSQLWCVIRAPSCWKPNWSLMCFLLKQTQKPKQKNLCFIFCFLWSRPPFLCPHGILFWGWHPIECYTSWMPWANVFSSDSRTNMIHGGPTVAWLWLLEACTGPFGWGVGSGTRTLNVTCSEAKSKLWALWNFSRAFPELFLPCGGAHYPSGKAVTTEGMYLDCRGVWVGGVCQVASV